MKKYIFIALAIISVLIVNLFQFNSYNDKYESLEDKLVDVKLQLDESKKNNDELVEEIEDLRSDYKLVEEKNERTVRDLDNVNTVLQELLFSKEEMDVRFSEAEYSLLKNNLPQYWKNVWDEVYKTQGEIKEEQIEEINRLLSPYFTGGSDQEVNPIGCFFTSYYKELKDIDLVAFLMYFPYGEVPEKLEEYEDLRKIDHWSFKDVDFENMVVPIHRYRRLVVQGVFENYGSIGIEELNRKEDLVYLKSTDSYYNYTSDFAPGYFNCDKGNVKGDLISLYGSSPNGTGEVLTIIRIGGEYVIQSYVGE